MQRITGRDPGRRRGRSRVRSRVRSRRRERGGDRAAYSVSTVGRSRSELDGRHLRAAIWSAVLRVSAFVAAGLTQILFEAHLIALGFAVVAVLAPWPAREYADTRIDGERFEVESPGPPRGLTA